MHMDDEHFSRVQLAAGLVASELEKIIGGDPGHIELVSAGINDVYRVGGTRFVKVYNPTFVDLAAQAQLHDFMRQSDRQLGLLVLPEEEASLKFIDVLGLQFGYSVFPAVRGTPLSHGDYRKAVAAGLQLRSLLNFKRCNAPSLPDYCLQTALNDLLVVLEPWKTGASKGVIERLLAVIARLRTIPLPAIGVQHEVQHGDFHYHNIFWTVDGPKIIDYDFARIAAAGYDLATVLWMEERKRGLRVGVRKFLTAAFRENIACCASKDDLTIAYYIDYLVILRHVFFLTVQAKLWTFRGSDYIRDERTTVLISFIEEFLSRPSIQGRGRPK